MAKVKVSVVHDEDGRIISVTRPSGQVKVEVLSSAGQAVLETECEAADIGALLKGGHAVDIDRKLIVAR